MLNNRPPKPSDQVSVSISEQKTIEAHGRAPTNIGKQGGHASAYVLIETLITSVAEDTGFDIALYRLFTFFSFLKGKIEKQILDIQNPDVHKKMDSDTQVQLNKLLGIDDELDLLIQFYKEQLFLLQKKQSSRKNELVEIINLIKLGATSGEYKAVTKELTIEILIQQIQNTAFPQEGNLPSPPNEGSLTRTSCRRLKEIAKETDKINEIDKVKIDKISKDASQKILNLFWHPKIPDSFLIKTSDPSQMREWQKTVKEKGYSTGTLPRDNSLDILKDVLLNHIDLISCYFPELFNNTPLADKIIENFIGLVLGDGKIEGINVGWELNNENKKAFYEDFKIQLKSYGIIQPPSEPSSVNKSREGSNSTSLVTGALGFSSSPSSHSHDSIPSSQDSDYTPDSDTKNLESLTHSIHIHEDNSQNQSDTDDELHEIKKLEQGKK